MTQEIGEPIRTKYTSCPSCGVFKVKDGWNYGEQICVCGFGKRPTEDEIENEQYLTAQVHNMLIDLIRLEQERDRLRAAASSVVMNAKNVIANASNTAAVRKGYVMGGYIKHHKVDTHDMTALQSALEDCDKLDVAMEDKDEG